MPETSPRLAVGGREHVLKTIPAYFEDVLQGAKNFEVRKNDRHFLVGDVLVLREWYPGAERFTERQIRRRVGYILDEFEPPRAGLQPGYVVLGLELPKVPVSASERERLARAIWGPDGGPHGRGGYTYDEAIHIRNCPAHTASHLCSRLVNEVHAAADRVLAALATDVGEVAHV